MVFKIYELKFYTMAFIQLLRFSQNFTSRVNKNLRTQSTFYFTLTSSYKILTR